MSESESKTNYIPYIIGVIVIIIIIVVIIIITQNNSITTTQIIIPTTTQNLRTINPKKIITTRSPNIPTTTQTLRTINPKKIMTTRPPNIPTTTQTLRTINSNKIMTKQPQTSKSPVIMTTSPPSSPQSTLPFFKLEDPTGIKLGKYNNISFNTFGLNSSLNNWTITILLSAVYTSSKWQGIIGNMYNSQIPGHKDGWGFWISPSKYLHFRISEWAEDLISLGGILENTPYKIIISFNNNAYKVQLIRMSDDASNIINISDKPKLTTDKGSICLGGVWEPYFYYKMLTTQPCIHSGVTIPGWSIEPNNPGYCIAPIGQKCCNSYTYNGQSVCSAGFGATNAGVGYDEKAMKEWKAGCITPPELFDGNITYVEFIPTESWGCTKCSESGTFACTNLPESKPLKGGGTIPANTTSLISNFRMDLYDAENPSYSENGNNYWWRQGGGCVTPTPTSYGCYKCSELGTLTCTNLPESKPLKGGGIIPANTTSLISNYRMGLYDVENPSYTLDGNNYWWRQGGRC